MDEKIQRIGFYIKVIDNQIRSHFNRVLKSYSLTKAQFDTLMFLCRMQNDGILVNQRDLETFFRISNPTVSSMLTRLEAKNYIVRTTDPGDRRIRYIKVTPEAVELISNIEALIKASRDKMFEGVSREELEDGQRFLSHILFNLTGKEDNEIDFDFSKPD
ncbi:MarR family winged helix-turn-helix transcriptional regulator [Allobaculum mucilyticum]|uniref:MarR family winged helix-turn-helix transcriptional regulator n=1 Tax=Allobaculum mucilyticum TaxID=2834459 RepID=UPI001E3E6EB3|nr:MarR family transcriptional regulator [Allobaculum mucilyticum]UNT95677.1 MarR family transcriptional regulator [Allobaculum mucilyticum]